jgi:hypothetical protein
MADVAWSYGTAVSPPTPNEPASVGKGEDVAALLDAAEDILNSAGPQIMAELAAEKQRKGRWRRKGRKRR